LWSRRLGEEVPVIATSSATGAGVRELGAELLRRVPALGLSVGAELDAPALNGAAGEAEEHELAEHMVFRPAATSGFVVERVAPGSFAVTGRGIERLLARYDIDNEDAMTYLEERLRKIGVLRALEAEGFQAGDDLEIAGVAFELDPDEPA
ncbi:MAG: Obg family GTPase CgtA, partial [Solirubrobacteraceae bacterium]